MRHMGVGFLGCPEWDLMHGKMKRKPLENSVQIEIPATCARTELYNP